MTKDLSVVNRVAVCGLLAPVIVMAAGPARAALTGSQVLQRCKQKYESLKSYRGTSHVVAKSTGRGSDAPIDTTTEIQFMRPGKIRVEGTMLNSAQYAYVSDGANTWQSSMRKPGTWDKSRSLDTAISTFAGMSQSAATTIPSILLASPVNDPLNVVGAVTVARDTIDGKQVYRLEASNKYTQSVFWIDSTTFLLVKLSQHSVLKKSHIKKGAVGGAPAEVVLDVTQTFTNVKTNEPIPASVFAQPKGAP